MSAAGGRFELPENLNIADRFLDARVREGLGGKAALRVGSAAWTYREVQTLAARFAHVLQGRGVRREERVLLALPDGAELVGAFFGCLKMGAVAVAINPQLEGGSLAALLAHVRPRLAVVGTAALPAFEAAALGLAWPRGFLTVGSPTAGASRDASGGHPRFEDEARGVSEDFETVATHRDETALWLFSGGTTGLPKAVPQSHGAFANTTELYAVRALGYRESDVTLSVPKLFFGYATGSNLFFPFAVGATAVLFPKHPTAEVLFEQVRRHRPTILVNVPTMVQHMVGHPEAAAQDLSCLRFATSAGEALPVPLYERWKKTFGVELLDGLGTAEMWHIFVTNRPGEVKPGTLGKVVEGFEIRVCDDDGRPVADGEVGRLWVRGASRAFGYWQNLRRTAECFRGEWFVGGDLVARDAHGWVSYCGRGDDMMKVGGKWVSPQEVESCLLRHPAVEECAVVGVENQDGLTKPVAFVLSPEPADGLEDALKTFALEHLAPYKHPRRILFPESFPRTHLGKVDRGKLRELAAEP